MQRPDTIQAVLFDFDGTLADTESRYKPLTRAAFAAVGVDVTDEEIASLSGTSSGDRVEKILRAHGSDAIAADVDANYPDVRHIYYGPLEAAPGAAELMAGLVQRGVGVWVVSTTATELVEEGLRRTGLAPYVSGVVGYEATQEHKPQPAPYLEGARRAGADPAHCVVVEDAQAGIAAGHAAGMYVVAFTGFPSLSDVSAADEQVADFHDLHL